MNNKQGFFQKIFNRKVVETPVEIPETTTEPRGEIRSLDIPPNDPLMAYISNSNGVIEIAKLNLDSPTLAKLREQGYQLILPLVSQGELIGLLNLGSRMSEQEYSGDDFRLLNNLAVQASPALRVAQLARQQLAEAQERERMEQELRVARVIQETLLPKEIPALTGWQIEVHWQPAREVGGDFYEFIYLPDGQLAILIADVTDKGVPAAMVMATTRSLLRAAAERLTQPGEVLARANELLHPDIPARMFVTCLYLVLDPKTGRMMYANAGHNLPYLRTATGVVELRATGMPLGLLPGMTYEQKEVTIQPGETVLLSSDGLVEAHNKQREMYSFGRVQEKMDAYDPESSLITYLLDDLSTFTGPGYEQEDDITLLTVRSLPAKTQPQYQTIAQFSFPSQPGGERAAAAQVLSAIAPFELDASRQKKLETAVAEAAMNAMEHGNQYQADKPVVIKIMASDSAIIIHITDQGGGKIVPSPEAPDLDAKLAGEQSPRGWGLFLIKNMVDEMNLIPGENQHTIELVIHR